MEMVDVLPQLEMMTLQSNLDLITWNISLVT